ncbi:MAG: histidine--tRNA ligase [Planctomycetaceae bacterium]
MNSRLIKPRTLKGFRDFLPAQMLAREQLTETARQVYRSYGFRPIDTPALEYTEILLGKGGGETDKQMFRFEDQGKRDVAMRFDLTIPFARFAAANLQEIGTPFKRYHIGTVWRAEKPQKGRYREFMQCDFDSIGTRSNTADIETLMVIHDLLDRIGTAFRIHDFDFRIHVNNRMVLNGLLESLELADRTADILRLLDKLPKIGAEKVNRGLVEEVQLTESQATRILELMHPPEASSQRDPYKELQTLRASLAGSELGNEGLDRLEELFRVCDDAGIPAERLVLDVSIARGLDYYTGTIYETFLSKLPGIGSVCSGGRYDNLAELYTSQALPGVGASLGLDRLLAALEELGELPTANTPAQVLIIALEAAHQGRLFALGRRLREAGIAAELYPEALKPGKSPGKHLSKQLKYANRQGFCVAVIAGEEEVASDSWQVKDLNKGEQTDVADADICEAVKRLLKG